jgi:hypothetical protein
MLPAYTERCAEKTRRRQKQAEQLGRLDRLADCGEAPAKAEDDEEVRRAIVLREDG